MDNPDTIVLDYLEEIIPEKKRYPFEIEQLIKQIQKVAKLTGIALKKGSHKYMVTDEVGLPNDVIHL